MILCLDAAATLFHQVLDMLKNGYDNKEDIIAVIKAADIVDWSEFFQLVATEGSLFLAESGSEEALHWLVDCISMILGPRNEKSIQMFAILLTVVYTFFDFALDVKRRFGITDEKISSFCNAVKEFKTILKQLMVKIGERNGKTFISFMNIVACTYYINIGKFFIASHMKNEVDDSSIYSFPTFYALHYYNKGLLAIHYKEFDDAEKFLTNAFRLIKIQVLGFPTKTRYLSDILFGE